MDGGAGRDASGSPGRAGLLLSGRVLYAGAMVGFGVVCVAYVDFLNSLQPVPTWLPGYRILAVLTGAVLVIAGLATGIKVKVQPAALALAALFASGIAVLHIPGAFSDPELLYSPFWIRTFESLALAGAALILAGLASHPVRASWLRMGRALFGISLPVFGVLHFIYPASVAALVAAEPIPFPWPMFWAYLTGAGHFAAGIAIAFDVMARTAATVAGAMYASWLFALHLPRVLDNPVARSVENPAGYAGDRQELTSTLVCLAFWGAAWIVAGSLSKAEVGTRDPTEQKEDLQDVPVA